MVGGITREGVKDLEGSRAPELVGDSMKPEWVMPSLASSSRRREPPLRGVPYWVCTTLGWPAVVVVAVVGAAEEAVVEVVAVAMASEVGKSPAAVRKVGEGGRY